MPSALIQLPPNGASLAEARAAIDRLRGKSFVIYSVEAIKLETLDRKVEVVSGNAPHASSVSTFGIIANTLMHIKRAFRKICIDRRNGVKHKK